MAPLLEIRNLSVALELPNAHLHAVRNATVSLDRGETLGIVGESGSGKSMTALALMRLLPRRAKVSVDRLAFDGQNLTAMPDAAFARGLLGRRISMIFQEPMTSLNPVYTIGRQLTEASVRQGVLSPKAARKRAIALLDRTGIPDPAGRMAQYPHQLSGGQRQRVMIAMALMMEPELLIADEPTTALDVTVQAQILALLSGLQREMSMAMILISHDLAVVSEHTDRVAVMYGGEMVEEGKAGDVMAAPKHPYTRALLNAIPRMDGPPAKLDAIPGTVPSATSMPRACIFAPRCDSALDICHSERPPVRGDDDHWRRCVLDDAATTVRQDAVPVQAVTHTAPAAGSAEAMIEAKGIVQVFQLRAGLFGSKKEIRAVDGVDLTLGKGETLALVGESGSGKSTLARIMLGLSTPTEGTVQMQGRRIEAMSPRERAALVQPIFQDPYSSLNPRRTLAEIIVRPLALRGDGTAQTRIARVREVMDMVRLPQRLIHNYPAQLSGGQRQRVAIARALATSPGALVCDEPTSALDVSVQAQILNLLTDLQADLGLSCLVITHDMAVVHQIADRVVVMLQGRLVEEGPTNAVLNHPENAYTRTLLAAAPRFKTEPNRLEPAAHE